MEGVVGGFDVALLARAFVFLSFFMVVVLIEFVVQLLIGSEKKELNWRSEFNAGAV